jgi:hypothetical protein
VNPKKPIERLSDKHSILWCQRELHPKLASA